MMTVDEAYRVQEYYRKRIFGSDGHVDTAREMAFRMKFHARKCELTGENKALSFYEGAMLQLRGARTDNRFAQSEGIFTAQEERENTAKIREVEIEILKELEISILQGCPCVK